MQNTKTPVMVLQELATKKGFAPPDYKIVRSISGTHLNRFDFVVSVGGIEAEGSGSSKQIGKHEAAHNALMQLKEMGVYNPANNPVTTFKAALENTDSSFKSTINCIVNLQNLCVENKAPPPVFTEISCVGPPHAREFTYECRIASLTAQAKGNSKKMAKQLVAKEMLEMVTSVLPELTTQVEDIRNALTEQDSKAIIKYNEIRAVIPDKTVKVSCMSHTLKKLMIQRNLTYKDDFERYFEDVSEENLRQILEKLELEYQTSIIQENPPMVSLDINIDTTFVLIAYGSTLAEARQRLLKQTFETIQCFMQIDVKREVI
ncbi:RISC-loading complex subunit tarbp2-like isoform X2 [Cylas formicarius]|uniref:RISC-loading complex subunit tarbp2-like isoform X2 n=1 Tax=Cylas formicarius TaxID=197179 RepID=UPI0029583C44|nr:RISC-loading complex subunit tarbp2-like isoform X2 [Cylas formicarius]